MYQTAMGPNVVVALDFDTPQAALHLAQKLDPKLCRVKVGKELFTLAGPSIVEQLQLLGFDVFLDLKFHDIPATVAKAVRAAANLGVWMVNVHASGGQRMMSEAREAIANFENKPLLIAVTVLTSMDQQELDGVLALHRPMNEQVARLANLTQNCGLDGVVCSAQESMTLKTLCGPKFVLVTPGIRPKGADSDDQRRIVTPEEAVRLGSHYLVVGRPISQAKDPAAACRSIVKSVENIR